MEIRLDGRTAFVSGSTRGIGYGTARLLAESGATVIVNGRDDHAVAQALASLRRDVPQATFHGLAADIASPDGADTVARQIQDIDILICNAATFDWTAFFDTVDADWQRHFEINVMSGVRLARAFMKGMLERNWGRVVLVASESGLNIPADMIHYGVSKAAQIALARGLAELTAGTGVTVNSVLPGPTASSNSDDFLKNYAAENDLPLEQAERHLIDSIRPTSLLRRFATVDEVASMIVYACSPQASATNGAALRVEGGMLRHPG
ncbi:hypothetical protein NT2_04_00220 [Caenibius tardaugens NBRC 16725]|uniref:Oxidoreductase n=1 Tax=Caenibius tardaugens NBRC 16725 TaxID=1219035 RepID=U2Y634_9SPHN|nr:SDR family oxidoreductase [Caenibius tardaugens]AZI36275.1 SDR family oxidoreductase [Caenibius tardaugens NBRC 16725]GAD48611.1 hypothetical protein NT2_04_00220 [Caenibius tardaugens NBRC 16725]